MTSATDTMTPMSAPLPAERAFSGVLAFQERYKISPTNGTKKPRTAKPADGASGAALAGHDVDEFVGPGRAEPALDLAGPDGE